MERTHSHKHSLLPFSVIEAASKGNVEAINAVLKHYEGYITASMIKCLNVYLFPNLTIIQTVIRAEVLP